jgi:ABC-type enterobactin transport system permease subunit
MNKIKKWHRGKILLLWIWGLVITAFSVDLLRSEEQVISGFLLIIIIIGIPVILSVMTWIWLSGLESKKE